MGHGAAWCLDNGLLQTTTSAPRTDYRTYSGKQKFMEQCLLYSVFLPCSRLPFRLDPSPKCGASCWGRGITCGECVSASGAEKGAGTQTLQRQGLSSSLSLAHSPSYHSAESLTGTVPKGRGCAHGKGTRWRRDNTGGGAGGRCFAVVVGAVCRSTKRWGMPGGQTAEAAMTQGRRFPPSGRATGNDAECVAAPEQSFVFHWFPRSGHRGEAKARCSGDACRSCRSPRTGSGSH